MTIDNYNVKYLSIIEDFKPDVIQVFGSEGSFALIQEYTITSVVIHLQGLINPYLNTYFPIAYSKIDFIFALGKSFRFK